MAILLPLWKGANVRRYDMVVIGTGPAGQKAAIQAAKLGRHVAIVQRDDWLGGVCIHTGTIPSKALREAVLRLPPQDLRGPVDIGEILDRTRSVIRSEVKVIRSQMARNGVEVVAGMAEFVDEHTVVARQDQREIVLQADFFVIAVGTTPSRPSYVPFDGVSVFDSDQLLTTDRLARSAIVVGGGVIGVEYACIFNALGVQVTLIEAQDTILDFVDQEVADALKYKMRYNRITLRMGEQVQNIEKLADGTVRATLESGKHVHGEMLLYSAGRLGATLGVGLEKVGLEADERGRLRVNGNFQTDVHHIYAAGDVIGFPSLASTSMEQGRAAACHAFGLPVQSMPELVPYGIYSLPEISMVGRTEGQLTKAGVPYEVGVAHYREIARGQLVGDDFGMLKLLFHEETRELLGVHVIGTSATELIHIGQAVLAFGGTIDYFVDNVFNYPTFAECYKVAALDGTNRIRRTLRLAA
jgi:NAD(P) transhydrogenase